VPLPGPADNSIPHGDEDITNNVLYEPRSFGPMHVHGVWKASEWGPVSTREDCNFCSVFDNARWACVIIMSVCHLITFELHDRLKKSAMNIIPLEGTPVHSVLAVK
jgi:hypothetical protein